MSVLSSNLEPLPDDFKREKRELSANSGRRSAKIRKQSALRKENIPKEGFEITKKLRGEAKGDVNPRASLLEQQLIMQQGREDTLEGWDDTNDDPHSQVNNVVRRILKTCNNYEN